MKRSLLVALLVSAAACAPSADGRQRVLLVTTTTVEDSGLLEHLTDAFHASQDRYRLSTTALGSGAALEIGRRGDADLLITHDPTEEARFMAESHGAEQGALMRSDFIVAGPPADPADIAGLTDLAAALDRIARAGATFISRADDSGTHHKELELWARAGRSGRGERTPSYVEAGSGMAETLRMADQREAYVLTDRGTFRHLAQGMVLEPLVTAAPPEVNSYQYTLPTRPPHPEAARALLAWLRGPGQAVIADYGASRFGEPLFQPATTAPTPDR